MTDLQPQPHQVTALAAITRALAAHDRTQLVSACGTGKTLTGRWYAQASDARITVVRAPKVYRNQPVPRLAELLRARDNSQELTAVTG